MKVSESINNVGSITFNSGVSIDLNQLIKASQFTANETTTGFHTATGGSFTFATGTGTVTATGSLSCLYDGVSATVSWADDHKTGTITSVGYYYIAENDTRTYSEAITDTPAWITVGERGTLSAGSGTINTEINGGGTISVAAGGGELSVSAEKLREFTGDLVVNSGRFNEVNNGHVFSNVTVANGGQFCINDGYNYTESVSIAGTGWNASDDYAKEGALRLGDGATLSGTLTLTGDANLIVYNGAKGTLSGTLDTGGHALTVKGNGKLLFGSSVVIGSGEGNANIVADNAHIGVRNGGSLSILKDYTCKGLYSDGQGTITIGDATHTIVNSVERIELGDSGTSGKITTLTVSANSVLKITGNNNDGNNYKTVSALLGEWTARTTATINGTLLSEGAALQAGDTGYTLNVESTGLVAAKGIKRAKGNSATIAVNLSEGKLVLGETGIEAGGVTATSTGGVIGSYADTTTIASALSLTSGTTTINTSQYTINADNTVTVPTTGATGSTITISGNISGGNGTKLEVTGKGEVILSGTDNSLQELMLSGGTTTISGATAVSGIKGDGIIAANDTIILTVSDTGILTHDGFQYTGTELSGLKNGLSMWNGDNAGNVRYNVLVSGGSITQTDNVTKTKKIYAKLSDVKLINTADKTSVLGVDAELSGASIGGTLEVGDNTTTTIKNSVTGSTGSSIATLTGSGTLKTTGGETSVTNASGFRGTLEATDGSLTANGTTTGDSGTVTLSTLAGLKATGGSIELAGVATLTITDLVVAGNGSISGAENYTANKVNIGAGEAGRLVGNLSIQDGGTITLDASAGATTETGGTKGLSLSALTTYADEGTSTTTGSLTLGSGLTLNLDKLGRLTKGDSLTLFSGVTAVNGLSADDLTSMRSGTLAAETVFNGVGTGNYNLRYSDNIVSIVAQRDTPEPTTATLSLLALMALAARRRRKA
ncbi:MAG: hypothetical protein MSQ05_08355 [Akkermansia sp.]|nr:hypothetical protein [Akkermansia sp.]